MVSKAEIVTLRLEGVCTRKAFAKCLKSERTLCTMFSWAYFEKRCLSIAELARNVI